ncbi:MAG: biopolymer transporter ExbD [Muribaculaceae bacterium]|nr:biopolymer transporter ExbD [Muribaculaceae bacterium]MCI6494221.1 biopolymer transporter ExbD [Bacteroidales bacterium]MDD6701520.1 biopolymer transporter ExbD [Bacteroidales bacterium]MDD6942781.1 biopolymer transporter ExbD [Bacteroidales bacterium]MDY2733341.1 biopolymer transporter ExbD [Muribaculaceae bacterium]
MALKRNFQSLDTFSMSSMTDVIFLLLIFFMVTSTIIFPSAIDVNLPQSSEQTSTKPITEVYINADNELFLVADRNDSTQVLSIPRKIELAQLETELRNIQALDSTRAIALYADSVVDYGKVVRVLDVAARNKLKMVLSTRVRDPE